MTAWPSVYGSTVIQNATIVTTAETILAQVPVTSDAAVASFLFGYTTLVVGTSGVTLRARIRLDSATGTVVGDSGIITAVAANNAQAIVMGGGPALELPNRLFVLTVVVGSASANSTVVAAGILVIPQF